MRKLIPVSLTILCSGLGLLYGASTHAQTNDCPTVYQPVCGANGKTYYNACHIIVPSDIYNSGYPETSIAHQGPCPGAIGSGIGAPSSTTPLTLPAIIPDIVIPQPTVKKCPLIYQPLCGIDNITYPNQCVADKQHMSIAFEGECGESNALIETCTQRFNGCSLCPVRDGQIGSCQQRTCTTWTQSRCTKHTYDLTTAMQTKIKTVYTSFYRSFRRKHGMKAAFLLKDLRDQLNQKIFDMNEDIDLTTISTVEFQRIKFTINVYHAFMKHIDTTITDQENYYYLP